MACRAVTCPPTHCASAKLAVKAYSLHHYKSHLQQQHSVTHTRVRPLALLTESSLSHSHTPSCTAHAQTRRQ